jgi:branched-chain amino acid aminotransferase
MWHNGKIIKWEEGTTHVMSHGLHYGSGVFEGIKCYNGHDGPTLFRLRDHIKRLFSSAKIHNIIIPFAIDELIEACKVLVSVNEVLNGYIRPIAFYGYDTLGVHPQSCPVTTSIAVFNWGEYLGKGALEKGVRVTISPWRKFHSSSFPTTAKASGQYINSMLAAKDAKAKGFDEALLLNQEGTIAEGAGQNIFIVKDNQLYTNIESASILMGITRDTVIKVAKNKNIIINTESLSLGQLFSADEVFFTGTASEITPVREVDGRKIGTGKPGPITKDLQKMYLDLVHGESENFEEWLTVVKN